MRRYITIGQSFKFILQLGNGRYQEFKGKISLPTGLNTVVSTF